MPVVTRVPVARPVVVRAAVEARVVPVRVVRAEPGVPAVPAATVPWEWVRSVRRALPAVMVGRAARAVPPGPAACAVMVARAVPAVLVGVVVTPARTRVRRDLSAEPEVWVVTPAPAVQRVPEWVPAARRAVRVWAEPAAPVARVVPVRMPRLGPRAMREVLVEPAVRAVPPELAACGAVAASVAMAVRVAGVVPPG